MNDTERLSKKATTKKSKPSKQNIRSDSSEINPRIINKTGNVGLDSSFKPFRVDSLNIKPKLTIEYYEKTRNIIYDEQFEKQLLELYDCLPTKPDLSLTKNTSLTEVLTKINDEFVKLKHPKSELVYEYSNISETFIAREYLVCGYTDNGSCISLAFLLKLKDLDIELHDKLVILFRFIKQQTQCNFLGFDDEEGYIDFALDTLQECEEVTTEELNSCLADYNDGPARMYYDLLKVPITEQEVLSLTFLNPVIEAWKNEIVNLLINESYPVQQFDFNYFDPDNNEGAPLYYSNTVGFYWKEDVLFKELDSFFEQNANQIGVCQPSWNKFYTPQGISGEIKDSSWPEHFFNAMRNFNNVLIVLENEYKID